jgi:tRNA pseudouridine13 synthase
MNSPDFEQQIGIERFWTDTSGVGGKLRAFPEDFQVTELFSYPPKAEDGRFLIAEVSSKNWETNNLIHELADRLHVSQRRISFAGTKDKRSLSIQLMSFENISPEHLASVTLPDVRIQNPYRSSIPVRIGGLYGNKFDIMVRDIPSTVSVEQLHPLIEKIQRYGGFPNFYGIQRFGAVRSITHLVGKFIVSDDFENAVMTYVAHPIKGEHEETYTLRETLERTRDYARAFHAYPASLNFEKAILNKLIQDPTDFTAALQELPKNLLMMFVHAYQSVLFNKMLSERLRRGLPIHQAIPGDLISPVRNSVVQDEYLPVSSTNIDKVNQQLRKKKAVVTGLLVGSDPCFAGGEMGDIEHMVLDQERINPKDFIIPDIPYLSSSGSRRALLALLPSLDWGLQPDETTIHQQALRLRFELQKGCYATSLLREFMKADDPKNY